MFKYANMLAALVVGTMSFAAVADTVTLRNGDRITGKVIRKEDQNLIFKTPYAGEIKISWLQIEALQTDQPVQVMLSDETSLNATFTPADEPGKVTLRSGKIIQTAPIDLSNIEYINPSPEVSGKGVRFTGHVNVGVNATSGNSETRSVYADAEMVARTKENRYTVGGKTQRSSEDGNKTADRTLIYSKYDHFLTEKHYLYANASFVRDEFKDLNLRSVLGAGLGHQFVESKRKNLSLEGGLTFVNEDFIDAEDDQYLAARWALDYDQFFFGDRLQFFHKHEGLQSLENSEDLIIRSETGVRVPFNENLSATVQVNVDWDRSPPPGTEDTDLTYLLTVGYNW